MSDLGSLASAIVLLHEVLACNNLKDFNFAIALNKTDMKKYNYC